MSDKETDENDDRDDAPEASSEPAEDVAPRDAERSPDDGADATADAEEGEEALETDLGSDVTSMLGPERWVQFGFIALAFVIFFVVDKITFEVWRRFAQPDAIASGAVAAILGLIGALFAYRHPQSRKLADEVVAELSQVTWPTRDETYISTVVVVITSVIAAAYTGVFDALWSALTDFVYTV